MILRRRGYLMEQRNSVSYKTVTGRKKGSLSAPMAYLVNQNLLVGRVLDYGCGKGVDATKLGLWRYDPYYYPDKPKGEFDTIVCNYVLNVVKDRRGREILAAIRELLAPGGVAYITVRADVKEDGFTGRGTYQRDVKLKYPVESKAGWYRMYRMEAGK